MRRLLGVLLLVAAVLLVLGGATTAVALGPDNRLQTGPHDLDTDQIAGVSSPSALTWAGPTVSVLVEVPGDKPVFIGVANAVDVNDYLANTGTLRIDSLRLPWDVETSTTPGKPVLPAAPTSLDWWIAQSAGEGGATITFELPDESVSVVALALGDTTLEGAQVTATYDVGGGFGIGLGLVALGIGAGVWGWIVLRRRVPEDGGEYAGDYVYVYVDEHGVEHEIAPEDLADYEIVESLDDDPAAGTTPAAEDPDAARGTR